MVTLTAVKMEEKPLCASPFFISLLLLLAWSEAPTTFFYENWRHF